MIWTLLSGLLISLWQRFAAFIILAGAVASALLVVFLQGRSAGKQVYRQKQEKLNDQAAQRTAKIVNKIQKAGNNEIQKKLDRYYRD